MSRRRLLTGFVVSLPLLAGCSSLPGPFAIATPTPTEPRLVRVAIPNLDLFQFFGTRIHNLSGHVSPQRYIRATVQPVDLNKGGKSPTTDAEVTSFYADALNSMTKETSPDLVLTDPITLPALARAQAVKELDPILKEATWFKASDFIGNVLDVGRVKGKQYALPLDVSVEYVTYSHRMFQLRGVPDPSPTWTWDEFVATAKKFTSRGSNNDDVWGMFVTPSTPSFLTLAWQQGAEVISAGGAQIDLTEPGTARAMDLLVDLVATSKLAPPVDPQLESARLNVFTRAFFSQAIAEFEALGRQRVAMAGSFAGGFAAIPSDNSFGFAAVPLAGKSVVLGFAGVQLAIPTNAPDPEHSLNALRGLVEASGQSMFLPARKGEDDLRKVESLLTESDASALSALRTSARFLPGDFPFEILPVIQREYTVPILTGQKKSIQAGKDAQQVVQEALKKLRG